MREKVDVRKEKYPLFTYLILTFNNYCNLKCPYCPRAYLDQPYEEMSFDNLKKLVADLKEIKYKARISLSIFGEPLSFKPLNKYLAYIRQELPKVTMFTDTNGTYIKGPETIVDLFKSGLNQIKINVYSKGTEEDIERQGKRIQVLKKYCIEACKELGIEPGGDGMFLGNKGIVDLVDKRYFMYEYSKGKFTKLCYSVFNEKHNSLVYNSVNNRAGFIVGKYKGEEKLAESLKRNCTQPFRRLVINPNGDVVLCCSDFTAGVVFGNVFEKNLVDIWNSYAMNVYRIRLANKNRNMTLCNVCDAAAGYHVSMLRSPTYGEKLDSKIIDMNFFNPNRNER